MIRKKSGLPNPLEGEPLENAMKRNWWLPHYQPGTGAKSAEKDDGDCSQNNLQAPQFVFHSRRPVVQGVIDFCAVFAWFILALAIINGVGFGLFEILREIFYF